MHHDIPWNIHFIFIHYFLILLPFIGRATIKITAVLQSSLLPQRRSYIIIKYVNYVIIYGDYIAMVNIEQIWKTYFIIECLFAQCKFLSISSVTICELPYWIDFISLSEIMFESLSIDAVSVALFQSCHIFLFLFVSKKVSICFLAVEIF